jgi:hypothetical protein
MLQVLLCELRVGLFENDFSEINYMRLRSAPLSEPWLRGIKFQLLNSAPLMRLMLLFLQLGVE